MDLPQLESLMQGQDVVYANLAGHLEAMAENIVQAMNHTNVKRLIWISSMGIYGETGEDHGAILEPYRRSAQMVENSRLDYTIIRPAWFTDGHEIDYQLTRKHRNRLRGKKSTEIQYFQVAMQLLENSNHEIGNLVNLPDNYQKTVLTANRMDMGDVDGVKVVHVVDWLVGEWYFYYAIEM